MIAKEKAVAGTLVNVTTLLGDHEPGVIVIVSPKPTPTGLVKVMMLSGAIWVRPIDELSVKART